MPPLDDEKADMRIPFFVFFKREEGEVPAAVVGCFEEVGVEAF